MFNRLLPPSLKLSWNLDLQRVSASPSPAVIEGDCDNNVVSNNDDKGRSETVTNVTKDPVMIPSVISVNPDPKEANPEPNDARWVGLFENNR